MTIDTDTARVREVEAPPIEHSPPDTVRELAEVPLRPGDPAVHVTSPEWFFILGHREAPAGEVQLCHGCTLAEWSECPTDADVVEAATVSRLQRSLGTYERFGDVLAAVRDGRVQRVALPEARLVRALEEFVDARDRGEWSGLRDYLEVSR